MTIRLVLKSIVCLLIGLWLSTGYSLSQTQTPFTILGSALSTAEDSSHSLSGWRIHLQGLSLDTSAISDQNGNYTFTNVPWGTYSLSEEIQSGWEQTLPPTTPSGNEFIEGHSFRIVQHLDSLAQNAYQYRITPQSLGGGGGSYGGYTIPTDLVADSDAVYQISVSTIYRIGMRAISKLNDSWVMTELVDSLGKTSVTFIGNFAIRPPHNNYTLLLNNSATDSSIINHIDFGNNMHKTITGTVFLDANGNHIKDSAEQGIPNWKVYIAGPTIDSTLTDGSGNYIFQNLPPGRYVINEASVTNGNQTYPQNVPLSPARDSLIWTFNHLFYQCYVLGADAYRYRLLSARLGGGGGSYINYTIPTDLVYVQDYGGMMVNGSPTSTQISFDGLSLRNFSNSINPIVCDSLGRVSALTLNGQFQTLGYQIVNANTSQNLFSNINFGNNNLSTSSITTSVGANGQINPSGTVTVSYGSNQTFTITPSIGYQIDSLIVDGVSQPVAGSYAFTDVTTNHQIRVIFSINTYTITSSVTGGNGTIAPLGSASVNYGSSQIYTMTPNTGYHIDSIFVDGSYTGNTSPDTIQNVTANHTITVKYAINSYTITSSVIGGNGTILPLGTTSVNYGGNQIYTMTPNTGYHIDSILVDGSYTGNTSPDTIKNVTANRTITVKFAINSYMITSSVTGGNGMISPLGTTNINYGGSQIYTMMANTGYHIDSIFVDGSYNGNSSPDTISNVTANHTITLKYSINKYTITATAGANGGISPSGSVMVSYGDSAVFTVTPAGAYHISDVVIDGGSVGAIPTYTFHTVTGNHTITASFTINGYTITSSVTGGNGMITPSGSISINSGRDTTVTMTPNTGYHIDSIFVDGSYTGNTSLDTIQNVTANHTITVKYAINTYAIISGVTGGNGTIAPFGTTTLNYGESQIYTMTPNTGYHIDSIFVDGSYSGTTSPDTIKNVKVNHTIRVTFANNQYTITASTSSNGMITPNGIIIVSYGSDTTFTITPNIGYNLDSLIVDSVRQPVTLSYSFTNVFSNHSIRATFALAPITVRLDIFEHWNLFSIPVFVTNDSVSNLFPLRNSNAFTYNGSGYVIKNKLNVGTGYWLKFSSLTIDTLVGLPLTSDSIPVTNGWNLIGSLSSPFLASSISSNPPGITTSKFFGYIGSYKTSDTIYPGKGYWIKVNQAGTLYLLSGSSASLDKNTSDARIKIVQTSELPPLPPAADGTPIDLPKDYSLDQNYPQPFNPSTTIRYALPTDSKVILKVYNLLGQVVATIVDGEVGAGYQSAQWNASACASGVYFYRIEATSTGRTAKTFTQVKKMVLVK